MSGDEYNGDECEGYGHPGPLSMRSPFMIFQYTPFFPYLNIKVTSLLHFLVVVIKLTSVSHSWTTNFHFFRTDYV